MSSTVKKAIVVGIVAGVVIWGWKRLKKMEEKDKLNKWQRNRK